MFLLWYWWLCQLGDKTFHSYNLFWRRRWIWPENLVLRISIVLATAPKIWRCVFYETTLILLLLFRKIASFLKFVRGSKLPTFVGVKFRSKSIYHVLNRSLIFINEFFCDWFLLWETGGRMSLFLFLPVLLLYHILKVQTIMNCAIK